MNPGQIYDAYKLINAMADQALGTNHLQVIDTTSFVSVGELILKTGYESTFNSISVVLSKTIFSARPYEGTRYASVRVSPDRWGGITRKVTPLYNDAVPSQDVNTAGNAGYPSDPAVTNLANGQSQDMYKICAPSFIQLNFYGQEALQKCITRFVHQLDTAFKNEAEFLQFIAAYMIEFFNEIKVLDEMKSEAVVLNRIAGQVAMGLSTVDLVAGFNGENGTQYTREQLLSNAHISDFMKYVAAEIKIYSNRFKDMRTGGYHANLQGYKPIPRHTPKARQKMLMYDPIFVKAESEVYSGLFNEKYLDIGKFEGVNYWQNPDDPAHIIVKPSILNTSTGAMETAAQAVDIPYVLGLLYDEEALGWVPVFDMSAVTPLNAAGLYWNTFYHWIFKSYNDYTENAIVFVLGNGGAGQDYRDTVRFVTDSGNPPKVEMKTANTNPNGDPLIVATVGGRIKSQISTVNTSSNGDPVIAATGAVGISNTTQSVPVRVTQMPASTASTVEAVETAEAVEAVETAKTVEAVEADVTAEPRKASRKKE